MTFFKLSAAAALVAAAFSASAMTAIDDQALSAVSGQDGVSIAANLNINIGSFQWTNNSAATAGGQTSVNFNNIDIKGLVAMTIDVVNNGAAKVGLDNAVTAYGGTAADQTAVNGYLGTSDVVQFAFPNLGVSHSLAPSISVGSITLGTGTASFGGVNIKNMDLQGTQVLIWAH